MSLPRDLLNGFVALVCEFLGTFFFFFLAFFSVQGGSPPIDDGGFSISSWWYVAAAWGASYTVSLAAFWRVSGGLFNPVLTVAMMLSGKMRLVKGLMFLPTELVASLAAAGLTKGLLPNHQRLASKVSLAPDLSVAQGLFIEVFATMVFVMAVLFTLPDERRRGIVFPATAGLIQLAISLPTLPYTGGGFNPFRAFAPSAVDGSFEKTHWIYWLGPMIGTAIATAVCFLIWQHERQKADLITIPIVRDKRRRSSDVEWGTRKSYDSQGDESPQAKTGTIPPLQVPPYGGFAYAGAPQPPTRQVSAPPSNFAGGRSRSMSDSEQFAPPSAWKGHRRLEGAPTRGEKRGSYGSR